MRKRRKQKSSSLFPIKIDQLEKLLKGKFENNPDLSFSVYEHENKKAAVFYISYLVDLEKAEEFLLNPLLTMQKEWANASIQNEIPLISGDATINKLEDILQKILLGTAFIYIEGEDSVVSYMLTNKEKRALTKAETESVVLGPQIAFTESLITNLNVICWSIRQQTLLWRKYCLEKKQFMKSD